MSKSITTSYGVAIREAFSYLLKNYPEVFVIGQGLWSPWYVGNSMTDLDKEFGVERIIDTPVSESACTGAAIGAALAGMKPIMVHPPTNPKNVTILCWKMQHSMIFQKSARLWDWWMNQPPV